MRLFTPALIVWLVVGPVGAQQASRHTYDGFMALPEEQKQETFAKLTPERKSALKQEHARRWLNSNRDSLSKQQVSLVQDAVQFLSPAYYADPTTPERRREEKALRQRLECSLGRVRVAEALTFDKSIAGQSWTEWLDEWMWWLKGCR